MTTTTGTERISGNTKLLMLSVAVLFDFLPLLAVLGVGGITFSMIDSAGSDSCAVSESLSALPWAAGVKLGADVLCGSSKGVAAGAAGGVMFLVGPVLYVGMSLLVSLLTVLVYSLWFGLHGVNMWAFRMNRLSTNLIAAVVENVPLLDLLPGTTFMVWRHIKISEVEDATKATTEASQAARGGRRMLAHKAQRYLGGAAAGASAALATRNAERRRGVEQNESLQSRPGGGGFDRLRRVAALSAAQEARMQRQSGRAGSAQHWTDVQKSLETKRGTPNQSGRGYNSPDNSGVAGVKNVASPTHNRTPKAANDNSPIPVQAAAA